MQLAHKFHSSDVQVKQISVIRVTIDFYFNNKMNTAHIFHDFNPTDVLGRDSIVSTSGACPAGPVFDICF
jgi:hypothetical protein